MRERDGFCTKKENCFLLIRAMMAKNQDHADVKKGRIGRWVKP